MEKIRVAVLLPGLGPAGIESIFKDLSSRWDKESFEIVYFLAVRPSSKQFWEEFVSQNGIQIVHLEDLTSTNLLKWLFSFYKALKKYGKFDVVHSNLDMLSGLSLMIAKLAGVNTRICHAHTSSSTKDRRISRIIYKSVMKFLIARFSNIKLACSEMAGNYFYNNSDYHVVYNGVDIDRFFTKYNENHSRDILRKDQYKFITIGQFSEPKNPFFLLDVFHEIYKIRNESTLIWIGHGKLYPQIHKLSLDKKLENAITFLERREDVDQILAQRRYFLFPSLFEGLGIVLIEAQASGLDCFISDSIPPIADCGKCLTLSLNLSANDWAKRIVQYIDSDETMTLDVEKLNKFDIKTMANRLMHFYKTKVSSQKDLS